MTTDTPPTIVITLDLRPWATVPNGPALAERAIELAVDYAGGAVFDGRAKRKTVWIPSLVPCSSHNYGLTESQGVVGAKRGGLRMDAYVDDERQNPWASWPPPEGLALNRPSAASRRLKGFTNPVPAADSLHLAGLRPINP